MRPLGKKYVSIQWDGLEELAGLVEDMGDQIEKIAIEEYNDFGMLLEEGVRALMPRDGSDLEGSYNVSKARLEGKEISIEGGTNSVYALRRHEEPYRNGIRPKYEDGAKFPGFYKNGRGARTRSKAGFRGEKAGRKYQERAVELLKKDYDEMNERILSRVLGGK